MLYDLFKSNPEINEKLESEQFKYSEQIMDMRILLALTPNKIAKYLNITPEQYIDYEYCELYIPVTFSGNSFLNTYLWWSLFNHSSNHNNVQASDKQKELVQNIKDSKTPVYMLEIKTKSGEIKHISVSKEQYNKVNINDYIVIKDGELEVKPKEGN